MPPGIMRAYLTMLPRLQAEESLRRVQEYQAGWGAKESQQIVRHWQRQIHAGDVHPPLNEEQMAARLAVIGIGYRKV